MLQNRSWRLTLGALVLLPLGAQAPPKLRVAPGDIALLTAPGVRVQEAQASGYPLPFSLSSFSVTLRQSLIEARTPAPVFSVRPAGPGAVEILVQVPYELIPNVPGSRRPENEAWLAVSDGARVAVEIPLDPLPDNIRILTACGLHPPAEPAAPCAPLVTHANGEMVSAASPARAGEPLVAYATGLGPTDPRTASGAAAAGILRSQPVALRFRFGPDDTPLPAEAGVTGGMADFGGLTPGFAGLYQIQFNAPEPPPGSPVCGGGIRSTLTIRFGGQTSAGSASICLQ